MKFTHLNQRQRYQIEQYLAAKKSMAFIALKLGVHRSTIYREVKRGQVAHRYESANAHRRAQKRRQASAQNQPRLSAEVWQIVKDRLREEWSPDEISQRLQVVGSVGSWSVSHQAIYNWLKRTQSPLVKKLRRYSSKNVWRETRGTFANGKQSIRKRPKEVNERQTLGHWEGDTIRGKTPHHCMVTLVERKSLYTLISPVLAKTAEGVARTINQQLDGLPAQTLTLDNGCEFAHFKTINTPTYFADPGRPRQRSRNENTNGLIRQYFKKSDRFSTISPQRIKMVQDRLNHRPRKTLGYLTPHEVLFGIPPSPVAIRS